MDTNWTEDGRGFILTHFLASRKFLLVAGWKLLVPLCEPIAPKRSTHPTNSLERNGRPQMIDHGHLHGGGGVGVTSQSRHHRAMSCMQNHWGQETELELRDVRWNCMASIGRLRPPGLNFPLD